MDVERFRNFINNVHGPTTENLGKVLDKLWRERIGVEESLRDLLG